MPKAHHPFARQRQEDLDRCSIRGGQRSLRKNEKLDFHVLVRIEEIVDLPGGRCPPHYARYRFIARQYAPQAARPSRTPAERNANDHLRRHQRLQRGAVASCQCNEEFASDTLFFDEARFLAHNLHVGMQLAQFFVARVAIRCPRLDIVSRGGWRTLGIFGAPRAEQRQAEQQNANASPRLKVR